MSSQPQLKKAKKIFFFHTIGKNQKIIQQVRPIHHQIFNVPIPEEPPSSESQIVESTQVDISSLERDPGLHLPIWSYPINERDNIRRAYIKLKACQPKLQNYPETLDKIQKRRFNYSWFEDFP
jgi:hypothetical protein